jgi:hypothetical protein
LVVLCVGSALLLVEDESTSVVNGALVGVLLGQSASPSVVLAPSSPNRQTLVSYREKILLLYSSYLPLGVPNGPVIYQASVPPHMEIPLFPPPSNFPKAQRPSRRSIGKLRPLRALSLVCPLHHRDSYPSAAVVMHRRSQCGAHFPRRYII